MIVLGVDPGKKGAIAALDEHGEILGFRDMPVVDNHLSPQLLRDVMADLGALDHGTVAIVEQVHSMPRQGVASSFDFGKSYGMALGVLAAFGVRIVNVTPTKWKKHHRLSADKEECRRKAIERWPQWAWAFKRKLDADRAEACLIALWFIEQQAKPEESE